MRRYEHAAATGEEPYLRDVEFHQAIARGSMNSAYAAALEAVSNTLTTVRRATDAVPGAVEEAAREHRTIAEFILAGNPAAARGDGDPH